MKDAVKILESILDIIEYKNDKAAFIDEFMDLCVRGALVEYMELLSESRKREFKQILLEKNPVRMKEQLEPYMKTEEYKKLLQESSENLFQDYLEKIMPIISEEQKNKLYTYFSSISENQQPASSNGI
jgi:hypothetical protein